MLTDASRGLWRGTISLATASLIILSTIPMAPSSAATALAAPSMATPASAPLCVADTHFADRFQGAWGAVWQPHSAQPGPRLTASATTGCLQITLPASGTYDSWADMYDNAPELLRSDLGPLAATWVATTHLTLAPSSSTGSSVSAGLVVRLGSSATSPLGPTQLFWGVVDNPGYPLKIRASATYNVNAFGSTIAEAAPATTTLGLRVGFRYDGGKCLYSFAYQARANGPFITMQETYGSCQPASQVGIFARTTGARAATVTVDHFTLQQGSQPALCTRGGPWADTFDGSLSPIWRSHVTAAGPRFLTQSLAGCLVVTTPATTTDYTAWASSDTAPELLRDDIGPVHAEWTATTRLTILSSRAVGASISAGLVVRITGGSDSKALGPFQIFWGLVKDSPTAPLLLRAAANSNINPFGSTIAEVAVATNTVALQMRYSAADCAYHFASMARDAQSFTTLPITFTTCAPSTNVGVYVSGTGVSRGTATAFDYFDLRLAPRASACTLGGAWTDNFDIAHPDTWLLRLPRAGPRFVTQKGCATLTLSTTAAYDSWADMYDNAPEMLLKTQHTTGNWMATTRLTLARSEATGGLQAGIVVRIPTTRGSVGPTQLFWGLTLWNGYPLLLQATTTYNATSSGRILAQVSGMPSTLTLRLTSTLKQQRCDISPTTRVYRFSYRLGDSGAFTTLPQTFERCEGVSALGIFGLTSAPLHAVVNFDWFDLRTSA